MGATTCGFCGGPSGACVEMHAHIVSIDGEPPFTWNVTTAETFHHRLNALPPVEHHRSAFLLGEASDHHGPGYEARYRIHRVSDGVFYEGSRPVTRAEFRDLTATL